MTAHSSRQGKVFVVVAYDIPDDRRRTRVHKKLKSFGTAVQYSVFEAILDHAGLAKMEKMIRTEIKGEDSVRLYSLCRQCQRRIIAIHGAVTEDAQTIVV
jgi:CRISPR-associated protein Cas2